MDMTPRQETAAVKKALIEAGFDKEVVNVGHGRGTAAAWLHILVNKLDDGRRFAGSVYGLRRYNASQALALATAQKVTGRHGDYDGRINITVSREEEEDDG